MMHLDLNKCVCGCVGVGVWVCVGVCVCGGEQGCVCYDSHLFSQLAKKSK